MLSRKAAALVALTVALKHSAIQAAAFILWLKKSPKGQHIAVWLEEDLIV